MIDLVCLEAVQEIMWNFFLGSFLPQVPHTGFLRLKGGGGVCPLHVGPASP